MLLNICLLSIFKLKFSIFIKFILKNSNISTDKKEKMHVNNGNLHSQIMWILFAQFIFVMYSILKIFYSKEEKKGKASIFNFSYKTYIQK